MHVCMYVWKSCPLQRAKLAPVCIIQTVPAHILTYIDSTMYVYVPVCIYKDIMEHIWTQNEKWRHMHTCPRACKQRRKNKWHRLQTSGTHLHTYIHTHIQKWTSQYIYTCTQTHSKLATESRPFQPQTYAIHHSTNTRTHAHGAWNQPRNHNGLRLRIRPCRSLYFRILADQNSRRYTPHFCVFLRVCEQSNVSGLNACPLCVVRACTLHMYA